MAALARPSQTCARSLKTATSKSLLTSSRRQPLHITSRPWTPTRNAALAIQSSTFSNDRSLHISLPRNTSRHASSSAPTTTQSSNPEDLLTWDRFFDLRRKRRYLNLGSSVVTAAGAVGAFGPIIAQQDIDGWAAQISGLDPIIVLGITTFAVAAGGWLCGPTFGNAFFKIWAGRKGWNQPIAEKEKSFFARIKRYRADPSSSSPQNPIPDYYGEKIASVKDYRRWLKDQRAFNLKKNKNML